MKYLVSFSFALILVSIYAFRNPGINSQSDCIKCHAEVINNIVVHPITETGCDFCHESNGEKHPGNKPGFELSASYPTLCYTCHDDKNSMSNVHTAVADGDCSMCHSPHSSLNKSLISDGYSENMCLDCHYIEIESAKIVHGPLMEGDCISCHDPHQSDYANALKMTPNELCLSCHDELIKINGREIRSIKENLESGYTIHEVISSGECINCHMAHTADYPDLLVANFPVNQYSNATVETFELCFMCHDSELLTAETTEYGTNFRNGTKNLHFLHINGNRGRNCRLCHDIHGAKYEHLLQESVMFGKWEMPLGLLLTEDGGSCATGCHKRKEYSRLIN